MSVTRETTVPYDYNLAPTIKRFSDSNAFIRGLSGPVGGGKSSGCVVECIARGLRQKRAADGWRRTRFAVVRGSYPQLRDTTMKTFFQWFPPEHYGRYTDNKHTFTIKKWPNTEIEILFRALDKPDDVRNLLSMELTGGWINEAREIPWAIVDAMQGRIGRYPAQRDGGGATWFGMWMDTNQPDVDSRWYKFFEEMKHPPGFAELFRQPSGLSEHAENLPNLPGGRRYYENLAIGKSTEWVNVYIHAEYGFVMDGKIVFPEYNDKIHCQKIDPVEGKVVRSWDFGLTPACIFSQVLPDGRWLVFDELVSEEMGIDRFSDEVLEHCSRTFPKRADFADWGDPAGMQRAQTDERTCFEILHAKDIMIEAGQQSLQLRLESVRKPLRTLISGEPQFVIHPRCRKLRKGFQGGYHYRRMQTTGERFTQLPNKNDFSHPMDALQYAATALFGGGLTRMQNADNDWPQAGALDGLGDLGRSTVTGY